LVAGGGGGGSGGGRGGALGAPPAFGVAGATGPGRRGGDGRSGPGPRPGRSAGARLGAFPVSRGRRQAGAPGLPSRPAAPGRGGGGAADRVTGGAAFPRGGPAQRAAAAGADRRRPGSWSACPGGDVGAGGRELAGARGAGAAG